MLASRSTFARSTTRSTSARVVTRVGSATTRAFKVRAGDVTVEVVKPLGMKIGRGPDIDGRQTVEVKFVVPGGNASKAGVKMGDQIMYHSSFFGDELWAADKASFAQTSINACPNSVDFVLNRGAKRKPNRDKKPAPPKFGRKLNASQKATATHMCVDCGYVYTQKKSFDDQPDGYACPQCNAPKSRFAEYDAETGQIKSNVATPAIVTALTVSMLGIVGYLTVTGLDL